MIDKNLEDVDQDLLRIERYIDLNIPLEKKPDTKSS